MSNAIDLGTFFKFLVSRPFRNECFASNLMVQRFIAGPNLKINMQSILVAIWYMLNFVIMIY